ncbi:uncharacterized protein [Procambarus clarkii]|uniref:uncharacterized protein n=1 Tax=Procambarus clarkii TaxID=6728 RepID=UPI001E67113A|nr:uncharacterized protein LOC123759602 [Procambarus clarkii]
MTPLSTVLWLLLWAACVMARQHGLLDQGVDQEEEDLEKISPQAKMAVHAETYEVLLSAQRENAAKWLKRYEVEGELDDDMIDEYFKVFLKTEISDIIDIMPRPLARFGFILKHPCVKCVVEYLKCKSFCLQLLAESLGHTTDMFACLSVCWQRVVSCCVASRRTKVKVAIKEA